MAQAPPSSPCLPHTLRHAAPKACFCHGLPLPTTSHGLCCPPGGPFPPPAQVLNGLHSQKRVPGVDAMLLRLYRPILFRALTAANAAVRRNSLLVMLDTFPLRVSARAQCTLHTHARMCLHIRACTFSSTCTRMLTAACWLATLPTDRRPAMCAAPSCSACAVK